MAKTDSKDSKEASTVNIELAPIAYEKSERYFLSDEYLEMPGNLLQKTDEAISKQIAITGLQTPTEISFYFQSEEGKELVVEIVKEVIEEEEMVQNIREAARKDELQHELVLAYLFYKSLWAREAFARQQMEQQEATHHMQSQSEQSKADYKEPPLAEANASIYDTVDNFLQKRLADTLVDTNSLADEFDELTKNIQTTTKQYELFDTYLEEAAEVMNRILHTTSESPPEEKLPTQIQLIEQQIATATAKMEAEASKVSEYLASHTIDEDNIAEVRSQLNISNAINIQIAALRDMLSVVKGESDLYTADGVRTDSFEEAQFILKRTSKIVNENGRLSLSPADQSTERDTEAQLALKRTMKLVNEDGKSYLLREDQDFATMSDPDKEAAHQLFKDVEPELLVVKKLTQHNKALDQEEQKVRKSSLSSRSENLQQDILHLANQITLLQAARAGAEASLAETPGTTPRPTPKPMKNNSVGVFKALGQLMRISSSHEAIRFVQQAAHRSNPELDSKLSGLKDPDHKSMELSERELKSLSIAAPKLSPLRAPVDEEIESPEPSSPSPFRTRLTPFNK